MTKSVRKLRACALKRNLGKELSQSVREMKADKRGRVPFVSEIPLGGRNG